METPEQLLSQYREIPIAQIRPSRTGAQAMRRKAFNKPAIAELAASIDQLGLAQPILVRPIVHPKSLNKLKGDPDYEIVAGERRFLAFQTLKREQIPCTVRHLGDEEVVELQLIENLQREDLHPMHEAESYDELVRVHGRTPEEIYDKVAKSRSYFYNRLKLLSLSPACRKAFYDGQISASIAEKIARIPVHSLQEEALEAVLGFPHAKQSWQRRAPMSFRDAVAHINEHFTLDLSLAPFPIDDEKLNNAGPCMKCPKMAGNQPELFPEVKKGKTCTDTVCFEAKTRAYGQRRLEEAKKNGAMIIVGPEAKKAAPNGVERSYDLQNGYHLADVKRWNGARDVEPRKDLKPGEQPALLQDPKSGRVVEVVHDRQLKKKNERAPSGPSMESKQRKKAELENRFRRTLWAALRPKLGRPTDHELARAAYNALDAELQKVVWTSRGVPIKKGKYGIFDRDHHENMIAKLKGEQLVSFMNDCIYAPTLRCNTWSSDKTPARLLAAAKKHRVDANKIRRELAVKKKLKAKAKGGRK